MLAGQANHVCPDYVRMAGASVYMETLGLGLDAQAYRSPFLQNNRVCVFPNRLALKKDISRHACLVLHNTQINTAAHKKAVPNGSNDIGRRIVTPPSLSFGVTHPWALRRVGSQGGSGRVSTGDLSDSLCPCPSLGVVLPLP